MNQLSQTLATKDPEIQDAINTEKKGKTNILNYSLRKFY